MGALAPPEIDGASLERSAADASGGTCGQSPLTPTLLLPTPPVASVGGRRSPLATADVAGGICRWLLTTGWHSPPPLPLPLTQPQLLAGAPRLPLLCLRCHLQVVTVSRPPPLPPPQSPGVHVVHAFRAFSILALLSSLLSLLSHSLPTFF